jgi:hypothetical protein
VRELARSIERAVAFGVDEMIDSNQLSSVRAAAPTQSWPIPSHTP